MIIKHVSIRNFRCLKSIDTPVDGLTILLGPNGAGKSSLLNALELFFNPGSKYDEDDFYNNNTSNPIEITLTFSGLNAGALSTFAHYISEGELTVTKELRWPIDRSSQKYFGKRLRNQDFIAVRDAEHADEVRKSYSTLRESYPELPEVRVKQQILDALDVWEQSNPDKCQHVRDSLRFFGYGEVGEGRIEKYVKFLPIPAIREPSHDATESKGSVLSELINLAIRKLLSNKPDIKELDVNTMSRYKEFLERDELKTLESGISDALSMFAPGVRVKIRWMTSEIDILSAIKANAFLIEDGHESPVALSGHGSQRAFVMALLQQLAVRPTIESEVTEGINQSELTLILAIEEPEMFQHPSRQRHLLNVLSQLALNGPGVGIVSNMQVIFTTHSPLLIHIDKFDSARRLYKKSMNASDPKQAIVAWASLSGIARLLEAADNLPANTYSEQSLRPRLQSIMTPWMNEGFFAETVVLVEGEEDRATVIAYARFLECDFDSIDVAVIPCGGKANIDRPFAIFNSLSIPTYVVWDNDRSSNGQQKEANHRLLRLLGQPIVDYPALINSKFAVFDGNLTIMLRNEIGGQLYDTLLTKYREVYGISRDDQAKKNPIVIRNIIEEASALGFASHNFKSLIDYILSMRHGA